MAQSDRQGTGRHPHKSTEEPYPHTKDNQGARDNQGEADHRSRSSHSGGADRSSHAGASHGGSSRGGGSSHSQSQGSSSDDADLKRREYRDEKGEVHHHTRTYMEQHRGDRNR